MLASSAGRSSKNLLLLKLVRLLAELARHLRDHTVCKEMQHPAHALTKNEQGNKAPNSQGLFEVTRLDAALRLQNRADLVLAQQRDRALHALLQRRRLARPIPGTQAS